MQEQRQNLPGDMQKTKNIRSEGEEACRLKLKNYEHGIRSTLIKKIGKPKWKLLSFKERLEILENEVGKKDVVAGLQLKSPEIGNKSDSAHNGSVGTHSPTKPPTVSSSTSMEDLVQIRLDADLEGATAIEKGRRRTF